MQKFSAPQVQWLKNTVSLEAIRRWQFRHTSRRRIDGVTTIGVRRVTKASENTKGKGFAGEVIFQKEQKIALVLFRRYGCSSGTVKG